MVNDFEFKRILTQLKKDAFGAAFACDYTISEISRKSGVSWSTLNNLYRNRTKSPHYRTIIRLLKAIGADINLVYDELGIIKPQRKIIKMRRKRAS